MVFSSAVQFFVSLSIVTDGKERNKICYYNMADKFRDPPKSGLEQDAHPSDFSR